MREFMTRYLCDLPASDFWALRVEQDFDRMIAAKDGQVFNLQWLNMSKDNDGHDVLERLVKLTFLKNPVPSALRRFLDDPEFAIKVRSKWWVDQYDEAHPMTYSLQLPVFSDRIKVDGWQWAEPISEHQCNLCCRVQISVSKMGMLTTQIEKSTISNMQIAYKALPARVLEYYKSEAHAEYLAKGGALPPTWRQSLSNPAEALPQLPDLSAAVVDSPERAAELLKQRTHALREALAMAEAQEVEIVQMSREAALTELRALQAELAAERTKSAELARRLERTETELRAERRLVTVVMGEVPARRRAAVLRRASVECAE